MAGPIVKASTAARQHGIKKKKNGKYNMKDSNGTVREVLPGDDVYHRGKKNFAKYSEDRDKSIHGRTNKKSKGTRKYIGSGEYRQLSDRVY